MSWQIQSTSLKALHGIRCSLLQNGEPVAFGCFASHLIGSTTFRRFWIQCLRDIPYQAYRWETPPVTAATMDQSFEFVAIEDSSLARPASASAFHEHLRNSPPNSAVTFPNLGADAILVVPTSASTDNFCHLGDFTHHAGEQHQHKFWQLVGQTLLKRIRARPVWLSTAGDGVPWLHVRLDDYPKYYAYSPYRNASKL
jgi:hypothetical protein